MYDYLVQSGVPLGSVAVYNLATPADHVEGGGTYLTSANDKVINYVRELDAETGAPQALPANIIIPEGSGYAADTWGGHLPSDYITGASEKIISDIQAALGKLTAPYPSQSSQACFTPPSLGLSYDAQKMAFSLVDPAVANLDYAATDAKYTLASVSANTNDIIHTAISDAVFSIFPKPDAESAGSAFAVEKALYGSSLSEADYEALLNGQDIPDDAPPANVAQQKVPQPQIEPATQTEPKTQPVPLAATPVASAPPIPPTSEPKNSRRHFHITGIWRGRRNCRYGAVRPRTIRLARGRSNIVRSITESGAERCNVYRNDD